MVIPVKYDLISHYCNDNRAFNAYWSRLSASKAQLTHMLTYESYCDTTTHIAIQEEADKKRRMRASLSR
jgi:hypothetical protein